MFSQNLTSQEALKLYFDLKKCKDPNHCPHGRPTFIRFEEKNLLKLFERKTVLKDGS